MTPAIDLPPLALSLALVALAACAAGRERILAVESGAGRLRVSDGGSG